MIIIFFLDTDFRFGISLQSVRHRYTEPINRYTESRYIVSSPVSTELTPKGTFEALFYGRMLVMKRYTDFRYTD